MSETVETQEPALVEQAVETHEKKTPQESFAELRQAKEQLERQLWQAKQEKEFFEKQATRQVPQVSQQSQDEDYDFNQLANEEFPDGKTLVKALNTFNKKLTGYEKQLQEKEQKIQILETAAEFRDFHEIVTPENIEKYIKTDEDNVEAVQTAKNPLRKVYSLIKKSAAYQNDQAAKKPVSQEQRRVDEKENKPKTGSMGVRSEAVTTAAKLSNSTMSKEQRAALWADTQAAAKGKR